MTARPDAAITCLRQLRAALERGDPVPVDVASWFVSAAQQYEAEAAAGLDLDRALGLAPDPGNESWWTIEARRSRDAAIRMLREHQHYADLGVTQAAREISRFAKDYQASAWRFDQKEAVKVPADPRKALVAEALRTGLPFPGERQVETILRNELPVLIS